MLSSVSGTNQVFTFNELFWKIYAWIQRHTFMILGVLPNVLVRERIGNSAKGNSPYDKIHLFAPIRMKQTHRTNLA